MKTDELIHILVGISIGLFFGLLGGALLAKFAPSEHIQKALDLRQQGIEVVEQCEAELPRNQHCEVVISAKVKGGDV